MDWMIDVGFGFWKLWTTSFTLPTTMVTNLTVDRFISGHLYNLHSQCVVTCLDFGRYPRPIQLMS